MDALIELLDAPDNSESAANLRAVIQDVPCTIIAIAQSISEGRGRYPNDSVTRACTEEVSLLEDVPGEQLRESIEAMLIGRDVDTALQWLFDIGAMNLLLPEVAATVDLNQEGGRAHKDVWEHTKLVVKQSVRRPAVRWAALLHDIGKVPTRRFTSDGVHFHGHDVVGARMFDKLSKRISFERDVRSKIRFLIRHHLRSNQYGADWTDSAVRRFIVDMGEHLKDQLDLSRADITSKRPGRRQSLLQGISNLATRIEELVAEDAKQPPLPTGVGNAMMTHFELPPSRLIGDLKRMMETAIETGALEERREDEYYLAWLEANDEAKQLMASHVDRAGHPASRRRRQKQE